jgi:hypothetical protein
MFRWRDPDDDQPRPSVVGISQRMLEHYTRWARELVRGGKVDKPDALALIGYTPVQNASYFVLPLTQGIHLFAVDRQLKDIDRRQVAHHLSWYQRHPDIHPWVMLPDPVYQFGRPSPTGTEMVRSLALDLHARAHFLLSGDIHHYVRFREERTLHVVAGGGGAFLHPAPAPGGSIAEDVAWPTPEQSRALLRQVPRKIATGRSGFLPHLALAGLFAPALSVGLTDFATPGLWMAGPVVAVGLVTICFALIGGARRQPRRTVPLAIAFALATVATPLATSHAVRWLLSRFALSMPSWAAALATLALAVWIGAWLFGAYLALLTRFGLEQTQAFTALDHPGFKHFLRLRVRADGQGIDGWCIGLVDPVAPDCEPALVDHFTWRPDEYE